MEKQIRGSWIRQNASVSQWLGLKNSRPSPGNRGFGVCVKLEREESPACAVGIQTIVIARAYAGDTLLAEYYVCREKDTDEEELQREIDGLTRPLGK